MPWMTDPKTTCFPSSQAVSEVQRKNCAGEGGGEGGRLDDIVRGGFSKKRFAQWARIIAFRSGGCVTCGCGHVPDSRWCSFRRWPCCDGWKKANNVLIITLDVGKRGGGVGKRGGGGGGSVLRFDPPRSVSSGCGPSCSTVFPFPDRVHFATTTPFYFSSYSPSPHPASFSRGNGSISKLNSLDDRRTTCHTTPRPRPHSTLT